MRILPPPVSTVFDIAMVGQQAAEELMVHLALAPDLHEIFCPSQCAAQHDQ